MVNVSPDAALAVNVSTVDKSAATALSPTSPTPARAPSVANAATAKGITFPIAYPQPLSFTFVINAAPK